MKREDAKLIALASSDERKGMSGYIMPLVTFLKKHAKRARPKRCAYNSVYFPDSTSRGRMTSHEGVTNMPFPSHSHV